MISTGSGRVRLFEGVDNFTNVYTFYSFRKLSISNKKISGWKRSTLIHSLNKKEKGHKEVEKIRFIRPNTILVGDDMNDAAMIDGEEKVLRIGVYDTAGLGGEGMAKKFNGKFDLVITDGKLHPVIKILKLWDKVKK